MGTGGAAVVGPASTSPWAAANRGEGGEGRRLAPALQVASMSSSFSSSTSSNSSASSGASNTSTSNPPTIGYFRPVYNGPRHLGVIEDVVTERGFSILPDKMIPVNAIATSPGQAVPPILGSTGNIQASRRIRSPSPSSGRRSRRGLAPVQRQSSTDSRPSSPTSNDSSIPPHRSSSAAPLPIHTQTATLAPGRWSASGGRWSEQYVGDTSTTNHDCTSGTLSGQERIFTSDESSTPYRSDSSSGRRHSVMEIQEIPRGRRPMKGETMAVALVMAVEEEDEGSPRFVEITEDGEKADGEQEVHPATVEKEAMEEAEEPPGADPGASEAMEEAAKGGDPLEDVDGAAGSALGAALAVVAADGGIGAPVDVGGSGDAGGGEGTAEKDIIPEGDSAPATEEKEESLPTHPCVPEGAEEKTEEGANEGGKGKKGEKEANNEMLKEVGKGDVDKEEKEAVEGGGEAAGEEKEGEEKKDEGQEKEMVEEEVVEKGGEESGEKGSVTAEGGEVVEVEGTVEGAGSGEGSKGAVVQEAPSVQTDQSDALRPSNRESNCGGSALPIDLSVGLLDADIDEQLREAQEKGRSFTTLPLEIPNSPPPRSKHMSCSYPSGALHLSPEDLQEDPMSFGIPPLSNIKGGDGTAMPPNSSNSNAHYGSKHHGQTRNGKIQQQRESRRSLPNRNGVSKQSINSTASAPSVHPNRSSSTSTALFPESLPPVKNPKEALRQSFQNMDDPDWEVAMKGLETLVRLIRHHPSYVQAELTRVIATLARQIRNLRSQVARAACQASGELALPRVAPASPTSVASDSSVSSTSLLRRALEADLEEVAAPLLHRSADTNRFLRDDCVAALDRFVAGVGPSRVVGPILSKGVTHQNALVRTVTARLLATIVAKLGAERVMTQLNKDVRAKVLRSGANLLMEGSLQTRTYAKQVFRCLAAHETFDRALTQSVPPTVLRNIHKTLLAIKKESLASAGADPSWDA
ncbi:uncharacterized protein [Hetaerina americana]|uniref:uncharacterized protein n=1 Tax=Hetaerina americana TaxID=62018 RepID=UPI003A7F2AB4